VLLERVAPLAREDEIIGMIGAEALRRHFLARQGLHVPQTLVENIG